MPQKKLPPLIQKFPAAKQRRMDLLLEKNSAGTITVRERASLEALVAEAEQLMIANGRRLATFVEQGKDSSAAAVPVTVWVSPVVTNR